MATKKPSTKGAARKPAPKSAEKASVLFTFADGTESRLSVLEVERQLQAQWRAMAASDDPGLRRSGKAKLRDVEQLTAEARLELVRRSIQRAKGGKVGAATRLQLALADWQQACIAAARKLLERGSAPRSLSGTLARQFDKNPTTVRRLLKNAGVI